MMSRPQFYRNARTLLAWLLLAGLWGSDEPARSELPAASEPEYRITRWTAENALPQSSVKAILQTRDGYLWIGTLNGLARFDGLRFKVFDHNNTPQMTHDSINAMAQDQTSDDLWIGTGDGLLRHRSRSFQHFGPSDGVVGMVGILQSARQGGVWFSSRAGQIGLARGDNVNAWNFAPSNAQYQVNQIGELNSASLLIRLSTPGTNIFRLDLTRKSLELLETPEERGGAFFWLDRDASVWLCTSSGIWRREAGKTWQQLTSANRTSPPWPSRIYRTGDGQDWVVEGEEHEGTLQRLMAGRLEPFVSPEWPADLTVNQLLEDHEGGLWVGTPFGLFRLERKLLKVYSRRDGLSNDDTVAVTESPNGTIYIGTRAGVTTMSAGGITNLSPPSAVFAADHLDRLWAATSQGQQGQVLMVFSEGQGRVVATPEYLPKLGGIQSLYEDRQQRIWIGSKHGALFRDSNGWTCLSKADGFSTGGARVIHQDRRGDLWFGTFGEGLMRLHNGQFTTYKTPRGEFNNRAWWIHEDADGIFWVGSEDGLNRFVPPDDPSASRPDSEGRFFTFKTEQGLRENVVNNIQEDDMGYLWLSGLHGIYRISRQQLNEVAAGKRLQVQCLALGEADGMLSSESNGGDNQPAGCKDRQGRILFPTLKGLVAIDPRNIRRIDVPPPVVIEQVRGNGEVVFGDDWQKASAISPATPSPPGSRSLLAETGPRTLRIGPGKARVLEFHYTANTLAAPERARFKYRLQGYDPDWRIDDANRRAASYPNLRPGTYTFQVIACNSHGIWNNEGARLTLSLAPHFYETTVFYALCGFLAIAVAFGIHHSRVRAIERLSRLEQQHALDLERARIARDIHDDLGSRFLQISVLGELSERNLQDPGQSRSHLEKLRTTAGEGFQALDEIVWAANPKKDSLEGLISYLREYVPQFLGPAGIQCRLNLPSPAPHKVLGAEERHELFLAIKEALQNVVKHSQATEVRLVLDVDETRIVLRLQDNGRGFALDPSPVQESPPHFAGGRRSTAAQVLDSSPAQGSPPQPLGNGLENMRQRMALVGGSLEVRTAPGQGSEIIFQLPVLPPA